MLQSAGTHVMLLEDLCCKVRALVKFLFVALLTMGSTVAKCRSHKDKGLLFVCIPKEEKDKHCLKNWRPITLLNTVYKIASSCIAARLNTVLPKLNGDDQKVFLKGRYIYREKY